MTGYTSMVGGSNHAFSMGSNRVGMMDLGILGGGESYAYGINDMWQVVGAFNVAKGPQHAFVTGPNGGDMTDPPTL